MKYRKKPVVIEAEQFHWDSRPWPKGVYEKTRPILNGPNRIDKLYYIDTLEGGHKVTDGDWIITGIKGERYPCKPDIFEQTYEPVEEADHDRAGD